MNLNKLSIGKRLAVVLGIVLALCLASSVFAVYQLRQMNARVQVMIGDQLKAERLAGDWYLNIYGGVQRVAAVARSSDPSLAEYFAPITAEVVRKTTELQKPLEALMDRPEEKALYARIGAQRKDYLAARDAVYKLKESGDAKAALSTFTEKLQPASDNYMNMIQQLVQLERDQLDQSAADVDRMRAETTLMLVVGAASALGLGLLLAIYLVRSITRPLHDAQAVAGAIADMDLSGAPRAHYSGDEAGQLLKSLDAMRAALKHALSQVRDAADSVSSASSQIASGNADLSSRTETTASNLQQTAGAMEELTGTVRHTADSARTAGQLAATASVAATQGGDVVRRVVSTMDEISAGSRRIEDIIGVIDSIAFQTNILALNAAVEAARAGEQGRGFAVVAAEVRTLAKRSAEAAREIKTLIGSSVEKVGLGVQLVEQAGQSMGDIVASVQRVHNIIAEITTASAEQSQGIGEVNTAVAQLDQMTQQNAALVEESSAAADSLRDQAMRLSDVVGGFRLT